MQISMRTSLWSGGPTWRNCWDSKVPGLFAKPFTATLFQFQSFRLQIGEANLHSRKTLPNGFKASDNALARAMADSQCNFLIGGHTMK